MVRDSQEGQSTDSGLTLSLNGDGGSADLQAIAAAVREVAQTRVEDAAGLLALLRMLEELHREICEECFRPALPDTRRALYSFLREIENHGGWPYIPRMRVKTLLAHLEAVESLESLNREDSPESPEG